jgi:hypothetical protein
VNIPKALNKISVKDAKTTKSQKNKRQKEGGAGKRTSAKRQKEKSKPKRL